MATHLGNGGYVKISTNTVAEIVDWSLTETVSPPTDISIGDSWATHKNGAVKSWSGSVSCYWDETDSTGQEAMTIDASVELHLLPDGEATDDIDFNGTATIVSIERSGANDSIVTANFSFTGNGALTRTVLT